MNLKISDDIAYNIINDWKKRNITPEEKSYFIKEYLKQNNLNERQLSRLLNIPHSTIHDWISMRQYKEKDNYTKLKINKKNEIYTLTNRLVFLLEKQNDFDEKTIKELEILKNKITDKITYI